MTKLAKCARCGKEVPDGVYAAAVAYPDNHTETLCKACVDELVKTGITMTTRYYRSGHEDPNHIHRVKNGTR